MMNKKKTLFKELIGSYIVFSITIVIILIFFGLLMFFGVVKNADSYIPDNLIDDSGKIVDSRLIDDHKAWVEKLDENNNIVETVGNKRDSINSYTDEDIMKLVNLKSNAEEFHTFIKFVGNNKYLIKIPTRNFNITLNLVESNTKRVNMGFLVFLLIYILLIILLSKNLSNKIKKPIGIMLEGMNRVESGEKNVQIDFHTRNELNDLKDNFNNMIVKIEREEELRIKKEEEKNRLLLDLSHDIKTPISTIKSYSIALKDGLVDEPKKDEYYDIIDRKATRISYLVDEMNNMLKLDNPDYNINLQRINFSEIIRNTVLEYYNELEKDGVEVIMEIPEDDIYLELDSNLIKRVLNNLLENQIKYNKGDFVRVILREEKDKIIFKVIDNGNLIDSNTKENLFNPFVRGDEARSSSGGLGLGLSISKKIVEKHGGEIYYSDEGNLNNFIIELRSK